VRFDAKVQIANASLSLLTFVISVILLGVIVLVLCAGLQINPFRETTTSFLVAAFAGLTGVAAVLVLLSVAMNISLIADAKTAERQIAPQRGGLRKWFVAFGAVAVLLSLVVFAGTFFSKEKYLGVVRSQADDVLKTNNDLLEEISQRLASGQLDDYRRISEIRTFLQSQRSQLPQLTLIYSATFSGKMAFYSVNYWVPAVGQDRYSPTYFTCTQNVDCDYLKRFFSGEKVEPLQRYTIREDRFYIYIPFIGKATRFVLLFDSRNSYGKLGS